MHRPTWGNYCSSIELRGDNFSRNINEILGSENELYRSMGDSWKSTLRCASPGIINSFDATTQTCTVQLALREEVTNEDYTKQWMNIPLLLDVPICIPRAGGFALTLNIIAIYLTQVCLQI